MTDSLNTAASNLRLTINVTKTEVTFQPAPGTHSPRLGILQQPFSRQTLSLPRTAWREMWKNELAQPLLPLENFALSCKTALA